MRVSGSVILAVLLASFAAQAAGTQQTVKQVEDPLAAGNMQIVSTEHTQEYLAKVGGLTQTTGVSPLNVTGNWSFELRDSKGRPVATVDLQLFQADSLVFGKGVMKSFGKNDQAITADGALLEGGSMLLGLVPLEEISLYRLNLNGLNTNAISGSFSAYSPGIATTTGSVSGSMSVSRGFTPFII